MTRKTDRFVVAVQPVEELAFHDMSKIRQMGGTLYKFMDSSRVPEADITLLGREVTEVPPEVKPYVDLHKHDVSELYAVIGGLTVEVMLDGERHEIKGPACVFIPAGITHAIRMLRGSGYVFAILRKGKYE